MGSACGIRCAPANGQSGEGVRLACSCALCIIRAAQTSAALAGAGTALVWASWLRPWRCAGGTSRSRQACAPIIASGALAMGSAWILCPRFSWFCLCGTSLPWIDDWHGARRLPVAYHRPLIVGWHAHDVSCTREANRARLCAYGRVVRSWLVVRGWCGARSTRPLHVTVDGCVLAG